MPDEPTNEDSVHKAGQQGIDGWYFIEFFCGSAGLTSCMKRIFPDSFGIDHKVNRPKSQVVSLDLQKPENQKLAMDWALDPKCLWVHFGIPCGTSSRARDRRMSKKHHGPPPLRSEKYPNGLPPHLLSPNLLARVRAANRLYLFMQQLILALPSTTIWTIENPLRSWLWKTIYFEKIKEGSDVLMLQFDMCMFGGKRLKRTAIATNCKPLNRFALQCDGNHTHAPYEYNNGKFDTSAEAEYPIRFCEALVQGVAESLEAQFQWEPLQWSKKPKQSHCAAAATNVQSRKVPQFVPEFETVVKVSNVPAQCTLPLDSKNNLTTCVTFTSGTTGVHIHAGHRLLRRTLKRGVDSAGNSGVGSRFTISLNLLRDSATAKHFSLGEVAAKSNNEQDCGEHLVIELCSGGDDVMVEEMIFGIFWEPEQYIKEVAAVGHPQHLYAGLATEVKEAILANVSLPYHELVVLRCKWFGKYLQVARDLKCEEERILDAMREDTRLIMQTKRIALLQRIIDDEGYVDTMLPNDLGRGFDLVGEIPHAGGRLPAKLVPATLSVDELSTNACRARQALRYGRGASGDESMDQQLYDKTLEERSKGWLVGPLLWDELEDSAVVSRRFGLWQGAKLRPIDDYSMSSINATVTSKDQATADNVDTICAMFLSFIEELSNKGRTASLLSRSFDLSAANRQLCVSADSRPFSYICVYNPYLKCNEVFSQVCLPFGSRAAVNAFIRCSRCIQWIAAKCLCIPTTCYYDDFVIATIPELERNSEACMSMLFELLGWKYDKTGPKADSFSNMVAALGVQISLSDSCAGMISVANTEKRRAEIAAMIDNYLESGTLQFKEGQILRGKMGFAQGQIFGLASKYALQLVSKHVHAKPFVPKMNSQLQAALLFFKERLQCGRPRKVHKAMRHTRFILTDAAFDADGSGGIGGILCSPTGQVEAWYERQLTSHDVSFFMREGQENAIAELETLAVVISVFLWKSLLLSQHIIFGLDNDVARFALMKGYSNSDGVNGLVRLMAVKCEELTILPWFLRVASASNLSDFPSRLKEHHLLLKQDRTSDQSLNETLNNVLEELALAP